ncbi:ABC transporter permease subunit [Nocardia sputi]|uniref:ABC transporter permease subunit n=1 Tax=Nocardia TaxID=1817 RepID=UPI0034E2FD74
MTLPPGRYGTGSDPPDSVAGPHFPLTPTTGSRDRPAQVRFRPFSTAGLLPLLAMFFGVTFGARAIAGDEESGYLDLLLAYPVSRTGLAL